MANEQMRCWVNNMRDFFNRSTSCLAESDSNFVPAPGMLTVAQQVEHVAATVDWFIDGGFLDKGFDMNFEAAMAKITQTTSLATAREHLQIAFDRAAQIAGSLSPADLQQPVAPGSMFAGMPKVAMLSCIEEHTAHHRGSLAVYTRLLGKTPKMPYMD